MDESKQAIRALSRSIFGGAQYRLEVMSSIHSDVPFSTVDLGILLADPPPGKSIHTEIKSLKAAGLIQPIDSPPSDRSKSYKPITCQLWDACRQLVALAEEGARRHAALVSALVAASSSDPELKRLLEAQVQLGKQPGLLGVYGLAKDHANNPAEVGVIHGHSD